MGIQIRNNGNPNRTGSDSVVRFVFFQFDSFCGQLSSRTTEAAECDGKLRRIQAGNISCLLSQVIVILIWGLWDDSVYLQIIPNPFNSGVCQLGGFKCQIEGVAKSAVANSGVFQPAFLRKVGGWVMVGCHE